MKCKIKTMPVGVGQNALSLILLGGDVMIVGVLSHLEVLADNLCKQINIQMNSNFQRISSVEWSQCMDIGVVVNYSKKFKLLQKLEAVYGNILVSGNLFLDSDVRNQITSSGGKVVLISMPQTGEEPQDDFTDPKFKLNPQDLIIFVSSDYSKETIEKFRDSVKDRKDVVEMSIEDSIKKAMMELGVNPDEKDSPESLETTDDMALEDFPDVEEPKISALPEEQPLSEPSNLVIEVPKNTSLINPTAEVPKTEIFHENSNLEVYLKIKDGTMVLFIPNGFEFETQTISNISYSTVVFRAPDLGDTGLQRLNVLNKPVLKTKQEIKPQKVKVTKIPDKAVDVSNMDLAALVKEKSNLDHQIKDARRAGDEELVKQLRKQRRHIREQINLWGDKS